MADLGQLAVIFDLDGTLIDSAAQIHATTNKVLAGIGLGPTDQATVQSFVGNGLPTLIDRLLAHHATPLSPQARADLIEKLNKLSDKELAQRGMSRDTIALHVFRDTYYI